MPGTVPAAPRLPFPNIRFARTAFSAPEILDSAPPETASFGPWRRSRHLSVLDVAGLRLWAPVGCGLARNQNLPHLDGH